MAVTRVPGPVAVLGERIIDRVPNEDGSVHAAPGGSPANVAVGLARLGVHPILLARAGDDEYAAVLDAHLVGNGLDMSGVLAAAGPSLVADCTRHADGSVRYDFRTAGVPDLDWTAESLEAALTVARDAGCVAWHTGSLASWLGPGVPALQQAWADARGAMTLSYDPNARPGTRPRDEVRAIVDAFASDANVVKCSDEDLEYLYPGVDPGQVASRWIDGGADLVVVTRGAAGVLAWRRAGAILDIPGVAVDVSDTVGAGDTLTAALLAGLAQADALGSDPSRRLAGLADDAVAGILARAARAAAITCSRPGADPPTTAELDAVSEVDG